jgi:hypothetical protein
MLRVSFRWLPVAPFPRLRGGKPALVGLAAAVIVLAAGCGGGGHKASASDVKTVTGGGFRFSAPSSWSVSRSGREVTAHGSSVDLVGVTTFRLARVYRPSLWRQAAEALDRTAADLAEYYDGELLARKTIVGGGRRARRYEIAYHSDGVATVEQIAFVLTGRREHQLLCRFERGGDDGACRTLFSSFRLG